MIKRLFPLFALALCFLCSCKNDDEEISAQLLPQISWDVSSARYQTYTGEALTLVPTLENTDDKTQIIWTADDGSILATGDSYTFVRQEAGTYYIRLRVTNSYGYAEDEVKVTVLEPENDEIPEVPDNDSTFSWRFPWTEINMSKGRTLKMKAYFIENEGNAHYTWTLDGQEVTGLSDEVAYIFHAESQGKHEVRLTMENDTCQRSQTFSINVCGPEGTYRRTGAGDSLVNRIYDYSPAPGHMVNGYVVVGQRFPSDCTAEQAQDTVLALLKREWMVSLGGQGGYLIAGFDHSVAEQGGEELLITGNPYDYQNEPGIIWVSQDDNGDGLPNDQWFELAGSEYGTANEQTEYAITYYRPTRTKSATVWKDCNGNSDYIPYLSYWNSSDYYWQPWIEGTEHTYFGSRLESHHTYENGASNMPAYSWGYADNKGSDYTDTGRYSIHNARTYDGEEANLQYIDFVKVQTAQNGWTPNLGEISTEVYSIKCGGK